MPIITFMGYAFLLTFLWLLRRLLSIDFYAFWQENVRGRHAGGSGASRPDQKVGPLGGSFGHSLSQKSVFENFGHKKIKLKHVQKTVQHSYILHEGPKVIDYRVWSALLTLFKFILRTGTLIF